MSKDEILLILMPVVIVLAVLGFFGTMCYRDLKHPCVRWEEQVCTRRECTWRMRPHDFTSPCFRYEVIKYDCEVCVERKP